MVRLRNAYGTEWLYNHHRTECLLSLGHRKGQYLIKYVTLLLESQTFKFKTLTNVVRLLFQLEL